MPKSKSSGPSVSNTGSGSNPSVGKKGATGFESTEGGQYDFMPDTYEGANQRDTKSGQSGNTSSTKIPWLPDKPEN